MGPDELIRGALPLGARTWRVKLADGREAVLKLASAQEYDLYRTRLTPETTGAPALLRAEAAGEQVWLMLEALPETYPDFARPEEVEAPYRHLAAIHRRFASGDLTLVHGDYHRWNLLLHDCRVRVVDWEHGREGHPIDDLVLVAPDEPGWDGVPRGALAELALRTYHAEGPLSQLSWPAFLRLHTRARLAVAERWARHHRQQAALAPPGGAAALIRAQAEREEARVQRLQAKLKEQA